MWENFGWNLIGFFAEMIRDSDPNEQLIQYILASFFLACHDATEIMLFRVLKI